MSPIHDARILAHFLRELEPYGIGRDRIAIEYQDVLQDYDVLISGGALTDTQVDQIWRATRMGGVVRFADRRNTERWFALLEREARKITDVREGS